MRITNHRNFTLGLAIVAIGLATIGCEQKSDNKDTLAEKSTGPVVYTTFYPTTYFAEQIAGDAVEVVNPCPPDADPATWMPDDATIAKYQAADLIIINGASFEEWVEKVTLPEERVVDTAEPLEDDFIMMAEAMTHSHGPGGEHTHEGVDGHTWLDPGNMTVQATQIKQALVKEFPEHEATFEENYQKLVDKLDSLDARLREVSKKLEGKVLLANHPAYNYVARRYDWDLKTFHLEPDAMPDEDTMAEIRAFLSEQPARYMLWESEPDQEVADKLRDEFGVEPIVFSPGESIDPADQQAGTDFLSIMQANAKRLEEHIAG